jgi:hypothetical protein
MKFAVAVTVPNPVSGEVGVCRTLAGAETDATADEEDEPRTNRLDTAVTVATPLILATPL